MEKEYLTPSVQRMGAKKVNKKWAIGEKKSAHVVVHASLARVYILCSLKLFELLERSPLLLRWLRALLV
jgi:hypothetical protein